MGRACARRALAKLGLHNAVLPVGADRAPVWPAGVVGSITHTKGYCAAAVAWKRDYVAIGIDVERARDIGDRITHSIAQPDELSSAKGVVSPEFAGVLVFSAKESVYKTWAPLTGTWLGFDEATVQFGRGGRLWARVGGGGLHARQNFPPVVEGRFALEGDLVCTAISVAAD